MAHLTILSVPMWASSAAAMVSVHVAKGVHRLGVRASMAKKSSCVCVCVGGGGGVCRGRGGLGWGERAQMVYVRGGGEGASGL